MDTKVLELRSPKYIRLYIRLVLMTMVVPSAWSFDSLLNKANLLPFRISTLGVPDWIFFVIDRWFDWSWISFYVNVTVNVNLNRWSFFIWCILTWNFIFLHCPRFCWYQMVVDACRFAVARLLLLRTLSSACLWGSSFADCSDSSLLPFDFLLVRVIFSGSIKLM